MADMADMAETDTRLTEKDLEHFRERLLDERQRILGDLIDIEAETREEDGDIGTLPQHLAEGASDADSGDVSRQLAENERDLVLEIDHALARVDDGTYGICEVTGRPIARERLEAEPWARRSIEAERQRGGAEPEPTRLERGVRPGT